jgi:hypothetical protein
MCSLLAQPEIMAPLSSTASHSIVAPPDDHYRALKDPDVYKTTGASVGQVRTIILGSRLTGVSDDLATAGRQLGKNNEPCQFFRRREIA